MHATNHLSFICHRAFCFFLCLPRPPFVRQPLCITPSGVFPVYSAAVPPPFAWPMPPLPSRALPACPHPLLLSVPLCISLKSLHCLAPPATISSRSQPPLRIWPHLDTSIPGSSCCLTSATHPRALLPLSLHRYTLLFFPYASEMLSAARRTHPKTACRQTV